MKRKYWDIEKELKTKTVKELALEMFNYYKSDTKELFQLAQSTALTAIKWDDVYKDYRERWINMHGLNQFGLDKADRKMHIYRELHKELSNLISNHL